MRLLRWLGVTFAVQLSVTAGAQPMAVWQDNEPWTETQTGFVVTYLFAIEQHLNQIKAQNTAMSTNISTLTTQSNANATTAHNREMLLAREMDFMTAQLLAEMSGAGVVGRRLNAAGTGYETPVTYNPSSVGLMRALRSGTEAAGIADGSNRSIWAQLDQIRINTASAGILPGYTGLLTQIRDNTAALQTAYNGEFADVLGELSSIDDKLAAGNVVAQDSYALLDVIVQCLRDEERNPYLVSIANNTLATHSAVQGLGTQFSNWRGESHNWAWFVDRFEEFTDSDTGPVTGPTLSVEALDPPASHIPFAAVKAKLAAKFAPLTERTVPTTDASTAPTWTWTFNDIPGFGSQTWTIGFGWVPSIYRTAIMVFCIFAVSIASLWMVWQELRRLG